MDVMAKILLGSRG